MKSLLLFSPLVGSLTIALCQTADSQPATPSPAVYHAKAEIVVRPPKDEDPVAFLRKHLPKDNPAITVKQLRAAPPSVTIELGFKHSDPKVAAQRANNVAKALPSQLYDVYGHPVFGVSKYAGIPQKNAK